MPTFTSLTLYSTAHCHLCEEAMTLLIGLKGLDVNVVEISESHTLTELYGARIPVLRRNDNNTEIAWPFDMHAIVQFASIN